MEKYNNISSSYQLETIQEGSTVTIFSGIHGNEHAGINAHERIKFELLTGEIKHKAGKIIGVTHANEKAIKIGKREVEKNLNRLFLDSNTSNECYEDRRAQELKSILRESDYLLDLHSTSGPSIPFAFVEKEQLRIYEKLGIEYLVAGWGDLEGDVVSGDTENYINNHGGAGITFESGNHDDPAGEEKAYQLILNYLSITGCIDNKYFKALSTESNTIHMSDVYVAKTNDFQYSISPNNFMDISNGTEIGRDGDQIVIAPHDMVLVMPKNQAIISKGIEVFFIGKR